MTRIPTVKGVMTPFPYSIGHDAPLADARTMMNEHQIHHLPVLREGKIAGVVEGWDVEVAAALGADELKRRVWDVCERDPHVVDLNERLDRVVAEMGGRRVRCVLVIREKRLVGILTATDVAQLLVERLRADAGVSDDDGDVA